MIQLVSIVLPAYNPGKYLQDAVTSVLEQTYQNWELLIVNDGSTDGTRRYLDSQIDPRIRVIHQVNQGVSAARNAALEIAQGDWVTFLDADDILPPDSLRMRVRYLEENPQVTLLDSVITIMDAGMGQTLRERVPGVSGPYFPRLIRLDESVFFNIAVMLRRESIGAVRFCEGLTHCEDLLFLLQASDGRNWVYGAVNESAYCYRTGNVSAMGNLIGLESGYCTLYKASQSLSQTTDSDIEYLYRRIRRILVRSWLRRWRPDCAWRAWSRLRSLGKK